MISFTSLLDQWDQARLNIHVQLWINPGCYIVQNYQIMISEHVIEINFGRASTDFRRSLRQWQSFLRKSRAMAFFIFDQSQYTFWQCFWRWKVQESNESLCFVRGFQSIALRRQNFGGWKRIKSQRRSVCQNQHGKVCKNAFFDKL